MVVCRAMSAGAKKIQGEAILCVNRVRVCSYMYVYTYM